MTGQYGGRPDLLGGNFDAQGMFQQIQALKSRLDALERSPGFVASSPAGLVTPGSDGWLTAPRPVALSIISNNTLSSNPDQYIQIPVKPRSQYALILYLNYDSGATPDFKADLTVPSGASTNGVVTESSAGAYTTFGTNGPIGGLIADGLGIGVDMTILFMGRLTTGNAGGIVQLRWAQNTSNASNTTLHAGSYMMMRPLP